MACGGGEQGFEGWPSVLVPVSGGRIEGGREGLGAVGDQVVEQGVAERIVAEFITAGAFQRQAEPLRRLAVQGLKARGAFADIVQCRQGQQQGTGLFGIVPAKRIIEKCEQSWILSKPE